MRITWVLLDAAKRAHPNNRRMQRRWLRAVRYLRQRSRCGWGVDNRVVRVEVKPA